MLGLNLTRFATQSIASDFVALKANIDYDLVQKVKNRGCRCDRDGSPVGEVPLLLLKEKHLLGYRTRSLLQRVEIDSGRKFVHTHVIAVFSSLLITLIHCND